MPGKVNLVFIQELSLLMNCLFQTGISMSYVIWALSSNLFIFILARFLGGISKGNVSLSMAIISDVSSVQSRGKGMVIYFFQHLLNSLFKCINLFQALVGIAFSLGFIIGPLIGAVFAIWAKSKTGQWFIVPAIFALLLSLADLLFFIIFFKETLPEVSFLYSKNNCTE